MNLYSEFGVPLPNGQLFIPDEEFDETVFHRTKTLAIGAHPDDLELLAIKAILEAYGLGERSFFGVVLTNGAGSPKSGPYADLLPDQMVKLRTLEQKAAAEIGRYSACLMCGMTSNDIKRPLTDATRIIRWLIEKTSPEAIWTHNFFDTHSTHQAAALCTIKAILSLPPEKRPKKLFGGEVWGSLDHFPDVLRLELDRPNLIRALVGVFDSQITGGKRYDEAFLGNLLAHATFGNSHETDKASHVALALDMSELLVATDTHAIDHYVDNVLMKMRAEIEARRSVVAFEI
jgi:LmbE family N-acetylglucosaminyl deacetylase